MQLHNGSGGHVYGRQANSGHSHYITGMQYLKSWSHKVPSAFNWVLKITSGSSEAVAASGRSCCRQNGRPGCQDVWVNILWTDTLWLSRAHRSIHTAGRGRVAVIPTRHCMKYFHVFVVIRLNCFLWMGNTVRTLSCPQCIARVTNRSHREFHWRRRCIWQYCLCKHILNY